MLPLLLASAASAAPTLGIAGGPAVLGGGSSTTEFVSSGFLLDVSATWHTGPFEYWLGLGGGPLLAYYDGAVGPAQLVEAEAGAGLGGRPFSAGLYVGSGIPGGTVGVYARIGLGDSDLGRLGLDTRLFGKDFGADEGAGGLAVLFRVEPGRRKAAPHPPRGGAPYPPPPYPPPPPPTEAPPADAGTAVPAGEEPPAEDDEGGTHHDDPY